MRIPENLGNKVKLFQFLIAITILGASILLYLYNWKVQVGSRYQAYASSFLGLLDNNITIMCRLRDRAEVAPITFNDAKWQLYQNADMLSKLSKKAGFPKRGKISEIYDSIVNWNRKYPQITCAEFIDILNGDPPFLSLSNIQRVIKIELYESKESQTDYVAILIVTLSAIASLISIYDLLRKQSPKTQYTSDDHGIVNKRVTQEVPNLKIQT